MKVLGRKEYSFGDLKEIYDRSNNTARAYARARPTLRDQLRESQGIAVAIELGRYRTVGNKRSPWEFVDGFGRFGEWEGLLEDNPAWVEKPIPVVELEFATRADLQKRAIEANGAIEGLSQCDQALGFVSLQRNHPNWSIRRVMEAVGMNANSVALGHRFAQGGLLVEALAKMANDSEVEPNLARRVLLSIDGGKYGFKSFYEQITKEKDANGKPLLSLKDFLETWEELESATDAEGKTAAEKHQEERKKRIEKLNDSDKGDFANSPFDEIEREVDSDYGAFFVPKSADVKAKLDKRIGKAEPEKNASFGSLAPFFRIEYGDFAKGSPKVVKVFEALTKYAEVAKSKPTQEELDSARYIAFDSIRKALGESSKKIAGAEKGEKAFQTLERLQAQSEAEPAE